MGQLVRLLWEICRLRKGPQDLPAVPVLVSLTLGADLVLSSLGRAMAATPLQALRESAVGLGAMVAFLFIVLAARGRRARFVQTVSAAAGTDAVITALLLVPMALARLGVLPGEILNGVVLLAIIWMVTVLAHVLRHALDVTMGIGVLLTVGYFVAAIALQQYLFPPPGPAA